MLLLVLVFGLPVTVGIGLSTGWSPFVRIPVADQPGGSIEGVVRSVDGEPLAGVDVEGFTLKRGGEVADRARASTGRDGTFAFEVPPITDGSYLVRAGGRAWQRSSRALSLASSPGEWVELELEPAAMLSVRLVDGEGAAAPVAGDFAVEREPSLFPRFGAEAPRVHGRFSEGTVEVGGLAPGVHSLELALDDGGRVAIETLELEAGPNELRLPVP